MTEPYRKRAKGGWNHDKDVSNRKERSYEARLVKDASIEDSAFVEDLVIRSECNQELNARLGGYEVEESNTGKSKKKKDYKKVISLLSSLRYIYNFALNHAHGDVENLRFPECSGEWFNRIRAEYYKDYKKKLPQVIKLLERDDLPKKIQRQIKEVLALFNIETP
jgi:hypothetical protein